MTFQPGELRVVKKQRWMNVYAWPEQVRPLTVFTVLFREERSTLHRVTGVLTILIEDGRIREVSEEFVELGSNKL